MIDLDAAVDGILQSSAASGKPLGVVVAGHNGSGKSTLWRRHLSPKISNSLDQRRPHDAVGASRAGQPGPPRQLGFVATRHQRELDACRAKGRRSLCRTGDDQQGRLRNGDGVLPLDRATGRDVQLKSRPDRANAVGWLFCSAVLRRLDEFGAFRRAGSDSRSGGRARCAPGKIVFTLRANAASDPRRIEIADASLLVDNSFDARSAFSVCRVQLRDEETFDLRRAAASAPSAILEWLDLVSPIARG